MIKILQNISGMRKNEVDKQRLNKEENLLMVQSKSISDVLDSWFFTNTCFYLVIEIMMIISLLYLNIPKSNKKHF